VRSCIPCSSSIYGFWLPIWYLQFFRIWENNYRYIYSLGNSLYHFSIKCTLKILMTMLQYYNACLTIYTYINLSRSRRGGDSMVFGFTTTTFWKVYIWVRVMVFNATFNNISVISRRPVLLVEETRVPGENHRPAASHWQTWSHKVVTSTPRLSGIVIKSLVFCVLYCRSLFSFVLFMCAHVFPVRLQYTVSDYPYGIFNFFV
jgi:hypothetical protein